MIYSCCNLNRKSAILNNPAVAVNGIDYLEVADQGSGPPQQTLNVHCLKAAPTNLTPDNVMIVGGESITDITVVSALPLAPLSNVLVVQTNKAGDFSTYVLRLVNSTTQAAEDPLDVREVLTGFDPQLAEVQFSFKVECGPNFDCKPQPPACSPIPPTPPPINYLAKDYGSFRTLILDRLNQLLPSWGGTNEADLGVALAELIAYRGDYLSYQQDAIATEAYLETARSRVSLRRHARLVDYQVHDGCNARAWIHLTVAANPGVAVFLDRTQTSFYTYAPGMPSTLTGNEEAALLSGVQVFQPMQNALLYSEHNEMPFYTWGDAECCLPQGAVEATLSGSYPNLQPGDVLIFEEVVGPQTANSADADLRHRCAVRLTQVATGDANGQPLVDPVFDQNGNPISDPTTQTPAPVTEIQWSEDDALPFPICISSAYVDANGGQIQTVVAHAGAAGTGYVVGDIITVTQSGASGGECEVTTIGGGGAVTGLSVVRQNAGAGYSVATALATTGGSGTNLEVDITAVSATNVSVALGNVVLADHGLFISGKELGTVPAPRLYLPPDPAADRCQSPVSPIPLPVRFRPQVPDAPLTQQVPLPLAGSPAPGVVLLGGTGPLNLLDSNGLVCLMIQATDPADWPQLFGVMVKQNQTTPANFDLSVIYNPPDGAFGMTTQVTLESFTNLSLTQTDVNYVATQINSLSKLIQVPPSYVPPATAPSGFPGTPTTLPNTGTVNLQDLSNPAVTYLTLEAANPTAEGTNPGWPQYFGVLAEGLESSTASQPATYNLAVVYYPPSGGVGVTLPVTLENFTRLSHATINQVNAKSQLVTAKSFGEAPSISIAAYDLMNFDPSEAVPVITLNGNLDGAPSSWNPEQDLLGSGASDPVFVVEIESDGTASLRFATPADPNSSETTNGMVPESGTAFVANYRIGNGTAGNVGAESLIYLSAVDARIQSCTNPLPASGGTDPETNDQIRRRAPQAFLSQDPSAIQRSVTMSDYEAVAENNPQVDQAVASLRWTGSWYSVFIAVEPTGGGNLTPSLQKTLKKTVERYRLAGQDLQLESPQYVSLQITLGVLVDPNYFQSDVEQSLLQVLGNQVLPNGQKGLFYPDNFTFGQTVYLSPVYKAARSVAGVISVTATQFQPQGVDSTQYLAAGQIKLGSLQVARLDNDPSYPDHGQLILNMQGGK
jgi:hypothetical protein